MSEFKRPRTFDWQASGSGDESWRGKSRQWIDHPEGETAALQTTKTWAVFESAPSSQGSEDSTSASTEQASDTSSSARPTPSADESSSGIGRECPSMPMFDPSMNQPQALTSSAAASRAKTSPSPEDARDSQASARGSSSSSCESPMTLWGSEGGSSSRTYPDSFPATVDEISPSFSRRWPSSGSTTSPGECWTHDTSESPSGGGVSSSLPDVLQATAPDRFSLSPRAARGILRRAEKRGKALPPALESVLQALSAQGEPMEVEQPTSTTTEPT